MPVQTIGPSGRRFLITLWLAALPGALALAALPPATQEAIPNASLPAPPRTAASGPARAADKVAGAGRATPGAGRIKVVPCF